MTRDRDRPNGAEIPTTSSGTRPSGSRRHSIGLLLRGLAALALLAPVAVVAAVPVAAAPLPAAGACSTGIGNQGGAGIICNVTIVNNITASGGSATVTVYECLGSAGDPTDGAVGHACTTTTTKAAKPVTAVTQCDGSANGGGATLRCSVVFTNNFLGVIPGATALTVNQCVGSGATTGCSPFPATTTGATITQCNGSGTGGNLVGMTCTASGKQASALAIKVNQCNGSGTDGGALLVCSVTMTNAVVTSFAPSASGASSGPSASGASSGPSAPSASAAIATPPPTSTSGSSNSSAPLFPLMVLLALIGLGLATAATQQRRIHL